MNVAHKTLTLIQETSLERPLIHQKFPPTRFKRIEGQRVEVPIYYACTFCDGVVSNTFANHFRDVAEISEAEFKLRPLCEPAIVEERIHLNRLHVPAVLPNV